MESSDVLRASGLWQCRAKFISIKAQKQTFSDWAKTKNFSKKYFCENFYEKCSNKKNTNKHNNVLNKVN